MWGGQLFSKNLILSHPTTHVAKLGEITGKTRVLYSEFGQITGKSRVLPFLPSLFLGWIAKSMG